MSAIYIGIDYDHENTEVRSIFRDRDKAVQWARDNSATIQAYIDRDGAIEAVDEFWRYDHTTAGSGPVRVSYFQTWGRCAVTEAEAVKLWEDEKRAHQIEGVGHAAYQKVLGEWEAGLRDQGLGIPRGYPAGSGSLTYCAFGQPPVIYPDDVKQAAEVARERAKASLRSFE